MTKKVLIVDDSMVSRLMIKEIISTAYPEWDFVQAANADVAVKACQSEQFDLITLDLNMPGRTGLEAAPEILDSQKNARIALLTANIQSAVKEKALNLGLEYVAKPITVDRILEFVGQT
jgi:CheY-like chemotaxis protein